ncbi:hypothetical protein LR48_Vigan01g090700 [Vigna angularis]|uniref:Uncharacterized protein n=1 Tax=Phaseolus angularis TaxID=3914 RepID=A0A0L9TLL4_PHAAN|nr:hypothetical protein LR48_Vigan01g090700 [Vigna angularis]
MVKKEGNPSGRCEKNGKSVMNWEEELWSRVHIFGQEEAKIHSFHPSEADFDAKAPIFNF